VLYRGRIKSIRSKVIKQLSGYKCQYVYKDGSTCRCSVRLDAHHETYARLGKERATDFTVLCRFHHKKVHGRI
jgi:hypothetical protein